MIGWLRRLFRRPDRLAVFAVRDRTGGVVKMLDPAVVRRALQEADPHWLAKVGQLASARKPLPPGTDDQTVARRLEAADLAARELADLTRSAFGLTPLDPATGGGWTEAEAVGVLADYLAYCQRLREKHLPLQVRP